MRDKLMVGNYVDLYHTPPDFGHGTIKMVKLPQGVYLQVTEILFGKITGIFPDQGQTEYNVEKWQEFDLGDVCPIRITEQALDRLGFRIEDNETYVYRFKGAMRVWVVSHRPNIWHVATVSNGSDGKCVNEFLVEYVHELQNKVYWTNKIELK